MFEGPNVVTILCCVFWCKSHPAPGEPLTVLREGTLNQQVLPLESPLGRFSACRPRSESLLLQPPSGLGHVLVHAPHGTRCAQLVLQQPSLSGPQLMWKLIKVVTATCDQGETPRSEERASHVS